MPASFWVVTGLILVIGGVIVVRLLLWGAGQIADGAVEGRQGDTEEFSQQLEAQMYQREGARPPKQLPEWDGVDRLGPMDNEAGL